MKNQDHINELLGRYFAKEELTGEQQKDMEQWIREHPEEFRKLQNLMAHTEKKLHETPIFNAEKAWKKVEPKLDNQRHRHLYVWRTITAIAASIVLIVAGIQFWFYKQAETMRFENQTAYMKNYLLPDSSEVILFPNSSVDCRFAQNDGPRKVQLNGKAFFQVKKSHGRKFQIKADEVLVEVVGTSFIVDASQSKKTLVQVRTGKVKVSSGSSDITLVKNEQVEIRSNKILMKQIDQPEKLFGFVQKKLVIQNENVDEVVRQIEMTTGVHISVEPTIGKNIITTQLELSRMDEVLQELSYLCKCQYEKTDDNHYRLYMNK